jgi:thiamine biosynthesis lipoprotein
LEALGSTAVVVVTDVSSLDQALNLLTAELSAIDVAASRFRRDSEIERLNAQAGELVPVSPLLADALAAALRAAALSDGDVDPTLGSELIANGYDRDWGELPHPPSGTGEPGPMRLRGRPSRRQVWRLIELDRQASTVRLPRGTRIDLGATAKALAADRAAASISDTLGCGVLVSLGGDIATAGPPPSHGWAIHVTDDHRASPGAKGQTIAIEGGGLATSSTEARRWIHEGQTMHHILDPRTGLPVRSAWRTVSVAASSCVDANTASTAAIVRSRRAVAWLHALNLPARLVDHAGNAHTVGAWPADVLEREWP